MAAEEAPERPALGPRSYSTAYQLDQDLTGPRGEVVVRTAPESPAGPPRDLRPPVETGEAAIRPSSPSPSPDALWGETFLGVYNNNPRSPSIARPARGEFPRLGTGTSLSSGSSRSLDVNLPARAQRCLDHMVFQVVMMILSVVHWLPYGFTFESWSVIGYPAELDAGSLPMLLFCTGFPILAATLLELAVRIVAQAGPLWRPSTYKRFLTPMFHKFELFVLSLMAYHAAVVAHLMYGVFMEDTSIPFHDMSRALWSSDQILASAVVVYRFMRIWAVKYNVSVQATEEAKKRRASANKDWSEEYEEERQKFERRLPVRLQKQVDKPCAQLTILLLVAVHIVVYMATRGNLWGLEFLYSVTAFTGYFTLTVFAFEFGVRCIAQSGEQFFRPNQHKAEFVFLLTGAIYVFYTTWNRNAVREEQADFKQGGTTIMVVFILHRLIRHIGIKKKISASVFDVQSVLDAQALHIFKAHFGDLLDVPPPNVQFQIQNGFKVCVQKACLKPEPFQELLFPFRVRGGLVEDLEIRVQDSMTTFIGVKKTAKTVIRVRNLLLLLNPSPGLAEAGGLVDDMSFWKHENVLQRHSALVDLVVRRLPVPQPPGSEQQGDQRKGGDTDELGPLDCDRSGSMHSEEVPGPCTRRSTIFSDTSDLDHSKSGNDAHLRTSVSRMKSIFVRAKDRVKEIAKTKSLQNVSITLTNVTMQYEDHTGELGCGHVALGMKIGKLLCNRVEHRRVDAEILRFGIYMETRSRTRQSCDTSASHNLTGGDSPSSLAGIRRTVSSSWRTKLSRLLESKPKHVIAEMKRLDIKEKFRLWAFVGMDQRRAVTDAQRHWRYERWPEQRLIFSLIRGQLTAEPSSAVSSPRTNAVEKWDWDVDLHPLRVVIDDEQVRALRVILACLKGWSLQADAFKWRPDLRHDELNEAIRSDPSLEVDGTERRIVARLWWSYAFRRVLALLHMKPRMPFVDVIWQSHSKHRYLTVLNNIIRRGPITVLRFKPRKDEKAELEMLQLRLSIFDVIDCQKRVLAEAARQVALQSVSNNDGSSSCWCRFFNGVKTYFWQFGHKESTLGITYSSEDEQPTVAGLFTEALDRGTDLRRNLMAGRVTKAATSLVGAVKTSTLATRQLADNALISAASAADSVEMWLFRRNDTRDAIGEQPVIEESSSQSSGESDVTRSDARSIDFSIEPFSFVPTVSSKDIQNTALRRAHLAAGEWSCKVPLVEVRILRWQEATNSMGMSVCSRGVVLQARVNDVDVEATIAGDDLEELSTPDSVNSPATPILVTATVGGFSARCQAPDLLVGGSRTVVGITQLCTVDPPTKGLLAGRRVGDEVAVILRAAIVTGNKAKGSLECHTADIRVVLFENLIATLKKYVQEEESALARLFVRLRRCWDRTEEREGEPVKYASGWTLPSINLLTIPSSPTRGPAPSVTRQEDLLPTRLIRRRDMRHIEVQDGRIGPLGCGTKVERGLGNHTRAKTAASRFRSSFHEQEAMVHTWRRFKQRLKKEQKRFEIFVGIAGSDLDWTCDFSIGALHVLQVGLYLRRANGGETLMVLEEFRMWPWLSVFRRGRALRTADAMGKRAATLSANGPWAPCSRPVDRSMVLCASANAASVGDSSDGRFPWRDRGGTDWSDGGRTRASSWFAKEDRITAESLEGVMHILTKPTVECFIKVFPTSEIGHGFVEKVAKLWQQEVHRARDVWGKFIVSLDEETERRWHCIEL